MTTFLNPTAFPTVTRDKLLSDAYLGTNDENYLRSLEAGTLVYVEAWGEQLEPSRQNRLWSGLEETLASLCHLASKGALVLRVVI